MRSAGRKGPHEGRLNAWPRLKSLFRERSTRGIPTRPKFPFRERSTRGIPTHLGARSFQKIHLETTRYREYPPAWTMDDAVEQLTSLVRSGDITPQTYAGGLRALRGDPPANPRPAPRPAPQPPAYRRPARRRPTSALRQPPPRERPTSAPHQRPKTIGDGAQTEETPGERPIPPPRGKGLRSRLRKRQANGLSRHYAEERPTAPSIDQDGAAERLVSLFLAGAITSQTYVNGLRALAETPLTPAPIPSPSRRRAPCDAQLPEETPGEQPIPPPRRQRAPRNAHLAKETSGERPIPPPRRRRAPRDAPPAEETPGERQLVSPDSLDH